MQDVLHIDMIEDIDGWGFTFDSVRYQIQGFTGSEIHVPINSFGGDVLEGFSIYNILRGHKAKVQVHIVTFAMSMGTVIAMAADEVTMAENGYFMIHNPWGGEMGEAEDMERTAAVLRKMTTDIVKVYKRKTGLSEAKLRGMMDAETWLTAQEAKEFGFVDRLTKGTRLAASFDKKDLNTFRNIPNNLMENNENNENENENPEQEQENAPKAGTGLASVLEGLIEMRLEQVEEMSRGDVLREMGEAAGISESTVRQILDGEINCPPIERLEGFASYFSESVDVLVDAAEGDDCVYGDAEEEASNKAGWISRIAQAVAGAFGIKLPKGANEATLISEINGIKSTWNAKTEKQITKIEAKIAENNGADVDLSAMNARIDALASDFTAMKATNEKLQKENATLTEQNATEKDEKEAAQKKLAEMKAKVKPTHSGKTPEVVNRLNKSASVELEINMSKRNK